VPPPLKAAARLGLSYRSATEADIPLLALVYASTRIEEVGRSGWPPETQQQFLIHQFDAQHRHYRQHYPAAEWLVIERDGTAAG
jgi:surfactin synthase thioesterase subunit